MQFAENRSSKNSKKQIDECNFTADDDVVFSNLLGESRKQYRWREEENHGDARSSKRECLFVCVCLCEAVKLLLVGLRGHGLHI